MALGGICTTATHAHSGPWEWEALVRRAHRHLWDPLREGGEHRADTAACVLPHYTGRAHLIPALLPSKDLASDELGWIIDLLEKDSVAVAQETFLDSNPLGERAPWHCTVHVATYMSLNRADPFPPLYLDLGNSCSQESLEEMKSANPFHQADLGYLLGTMSPGSSDISGKLYCLCSALWPAWPLAQVWHMPAPCAERSGVLLVCPSSLLRDKAALCHCSVKAWPCHAWNSS